VLQILLAEHDPLDQQVTQLLLARLGHQVDAVTNGFDAVGRAAGSHYDAVFVDPWLPELDGLETTGRIRAELPPRDQPYVVAVTESTGIEQRAACYAAGVDTHLTKPVRFDELNAVLTPLARATPPARAHDLHARATDLLGPAPAPAEKAVLVEVIDNFCGRAETAVDELAAEVAAGATAAAARTAHRLKGSAGNVGAHVLAELIALFEDHLRIGAGLGPSSLLSRIRQETEQACRALAGLRDQLLTEPER
jgi:CheY-like chemotaxis protein